MRRPAARTFAALRRRELFSPRVSMWTRQNLTLRKIPSLRLQTRSRSGADTALCHVLRSSRIQQNRAPRRALPARDLAWPAQLGTWFFRRCFRSLGSVYSDLGKLFPLLAALAPCESFFCRICMVRGRTRSIKWRCLHCTMISTSSDVPLPLPSGGQQTTWGGS